jgi:hypothetical protein
MKTTTAHVSLAGVKPGYQLRAQRLFHGLSEMGFHLEFIPAAGHYSISLIKGGVIAPGLTLDEVEDFWSLSLRASEAHMISPASRPRNRSTVVIAMMENYIANRVGIVRALHRLEEDPVGIGVKPFVRKAVSASAQSRVRDSRSKTGKLGVPPLQDIPMPAVREPRSRPRP